MRATGSDSLGSDSLPLAGARVVLHRVAQAAQGPVDSAVTGPDGGFRFSFARDTATLHLLSARHHGIEYFSTPLDDRGSGGTGAVTLVVHDTSSNAPVGISARHVVIPRAGDDGAREVLDLVLLVNAGMETRVAPDSLGASWTGPLPPRSEGLELGESDVSPDAVVRRGDSAIVSAPIAPGEKQLVLQYHLPAGRQEIEIPVGAEPVSMNVLLEEPGAAATAPGLTLADTQPIEGRSFRRWRGDLPANATVRVTLPGARSGGGPILAALVAALALALLAAAWRMLPRARAVPADRLVGEIALLDTRYQGREAETPPEEWTRYLERRGNLKAQLEAALRLLLCAVVLALPACRQPGPQARTLVLMDDAGDSVAVRVPATRVVSLIPASTELLFAIGAGPAVVGRTQWCNFPPAAAAAPDLGDGVNPNLESVLSARPDLVVLYNSAQHAGVATRLRGLGVPAIRINTDALADVPRVGALLGRLTGHAREADSIGAVFDTALASATVEPGSAGRPKVLLLVWEQPPMTIGRGSFLSELVERAGGENLFGDVATSSGPVSIEAVSVRDPDLILTTAAGPASFARRPEWQVVRAVREQRFLHLSGSEYDRPGPRSPGAIRALSRRLREAAR